jgi:hypothetical protein
MWVPAFRWKAMDMTKVLHGKVRGRIIELSEDVGLADGQVVEIQLHVVPQRPLWGEGLRYCAGALTDDSEWDGIMNEIHQARKMERRARTEPE